MQPSIPVGGRADHQVMLRPYQSEIAWRDALTVAVKSYDYDAWKPLGPDARLSRSEGET